MFKILLQQFHRSTWQQPTVSLFRKALSGCLACATVVLLGLQLHQANQHRSQVRSIQFEQLQGEWTHAGQSLLNQQVLPTPQHASTHFHVGPLDSQHRPNGWPADCSRQMAGLRGEGYTLLTCPGGQDMHLYQGWIARNGQAQGLQLHAFAQLDHMPLLTQAFDLSTLGFWILSAALAWLVAEWLVRALRQSMQEIARLAQRLSEGQHHTHLTPTGLTELDQLSQAFVGMADQILERDRVIRRTAYKDPITNLDNRSYLLMALRERIDRAREPLSLITWGIDNVDSINEVMGHEFSDALLRKVAKRARRLLSHSLVIARLEGAVFCALMPHSMYVRGLANSSPSRMLQCDIQLQGHTVDLDCHAGVAHFPQHGQNAELLLRRAEMARHFAKKSHSALLEFDPVFEEKSGHRLALLAELKRAIAQQEFVLYLQPKMNLRTGAISQAEVLIRWQHPVRGLVMPGAFIPLAEQTGLIKDISLWLLNALYQLCPQFSSQNIRLSMNISALDLEDEQFINAVHKLHHQHPHTSRGITLEVTESSTMQDPEKACGLLQKLAHLGFEISIDDFGSGYSSLAYLKRFPVSELKIDRSLVQGIEEDADARVILQSTIEMGHVMGLQVTTEGVETELEYQIIHDLGADFLQGYWLSRPVPLTQFLAQYGRAEVD